jgi:hypothetical protein
MEGTIMVKTIRCKGCRRIVPANPRLKKNEQSYCGATACQSKRKAEWHKAKIASDPAYKDQRAQDKSEYEKRNPGRSSRYRAANQESSERNRLLQIQRDQKRLKRKEPEAGQNSEPGAPDSSGEKIRINTDGYEKLEQNLATTDASGKEILFKPGIYEISQKNCDLATTDALKGKFLIIPKEYIDLATTDAIDFCKTGLYSSCQPITPKEETDENRKTSHQTGPDS